MKYVVTGATSGLGRNLAERLCRDGHQVMALGRRIKEGQELVKAGADFHSINLEDSQAMINIMQGADAVFHCAALSSPWGKYEDFYAANVTGTENVISAMEACSIPFLIHVSTPSLYFDYADRMDIRETDPLPKKLVNDYAVTKKMAEDRVVDACAKERIKATIFRPRAIIGPHDRNILPRLLHVARKGFMPLINGGTAMLDITYVENVVDAMLLALKPGVHHSGKIYNITNGEPITLRDLVTATFNELQMNIPTKEIPYSLVHYLSAGMEAICKILPTRPEPPLTKYSAGVFAFSQTLNIDAAKSVLGYRPRISLSEGIREAATWWKNNANKI